MLRFLGVSQLEFSQPDWSLSAFGLIDIHERDGGFHVTEDEGRLRFACTGFEASSVH